MHVPTHTIRVNWWTELNFQLFLELCIPGVTYFKCCPCLSKAKIYFDFEKKSLILQIFFYFPTDSMIPWNIFCVFIISWIACNFETYIRWWVMGCGIVLFLTIVLSIKPPDGGIKVKTRVIMVIGFSPCNWFHWRSTYNCK